MIRRVAMVSVALAILSSPARASSSIIASCPPVSFAPVAQRAIISVESGGDALAIGDNDAHRSYHPATVERAVAIADDLLGQGHSIDMGIAQINSIHLRGFGLSPRDLFDPCVNLEVSQHILYGNYMKAERAFGPGQLALYHAISAYNTGSLWAGEAYVRKVLAAAGAAPPVVVANQSTRVPLRARAKQQHQSHAVITYTPENSPIMVRVTQLPNGQEVIQSIGTRP